HYMVTWMDRNTETFTQMGGEGASWIGQAPFTSTPHVFQNLGDGTYFHSGILAIRAAIASGANITYKILYNDAVAMTGGQHIDGSLTVEQLALQLRGEGVGRIAVVSDAPEHYGADFPRFDGLTIDHRDDLDAIQRALRELPGTTVIIYEQTCATEIRRRRKRGEIVDPARRVFINEEVCEGCGDCGVQSNCLAVVPKETPLGRKRAIDQSACNKDFSCLKGFCPSFVTVEGGRLHKNTAATGDEAVFPPLPDPVLPIIHEPYNILLTGVGGMGVLTVGSVLGMAAHIEGKGAAVLTQTGLAQKFGAVTSHVRIARRQDDIHSARVAVGGGHLLLGADLVVSSGSDALARMSASQAHAVVNSHDSPTADFTHNPDAPFPGPAMTAAINAAVGTERAWFFDATTLGTALLGDAIASNFFLLGYAWQRGLVPVGEVALTAAIRLNAVQVDFNLKAFLWGRRYAEYPDLVRERAGLAEPGSLEAPAESLGDALDNRLDNLITDRRRRLVDYQNARYAERYGLLVERVRSAEAALPGVKNSALTEAVARNYFKLLAYKDEYEVARLYTDGRFQRELARQFDGDYRLHFHLAPPLLSKRDPRTGHLIKREFGPWIFSVFKVLAKLKFLRGTVFDIAGRTAERRMERRLIGDYEKQIDQVLDQLTPANHPLAVELAGLPHFIRGFGHVKEANVATVGRRAQSLLNRLRDERETSVRMLEVTEVVG
ncbi:MAG: indolepyruvate ferredoxin oxidoreductase family protein, partial [Porticoccaceae bacterium]